MSTMLLGFVLYIANFTCPWTNLLGWGCSGLVANRAQNRGEAAKHNTAPNTKHLHSVTQLLRNIFSCVNGTAAQEKEENTHWGYRKAGSVSMSPLNTPLPCARMRHGSRGATRVMLATVVLVSDPTQEEAKRSGHSEGVTLQVGQDLVNHWKLCGSTNIW